MISPNNFNRREGYRPRSQSVDDEIAAMFLKGEAVYRIARSIPINERSVREVINERKLVSPTGVHKSTIKRAERGHAVKLPEITYRTILD